MQILGEWLQCEDGVVRPVIRGHVETAGGIWEPVSLLVDTGADRTVLSASVLELLEAPGEDPSLPISGLGGFVDSVVVSARTRFDRTDGGIAAFRGLYAACTSFELLDMSVLGRDILNLFAVIVDRPGDRVCLLSQRHGYVIQSR